MPFEQRSYSLNDWQQPNAVLYIFDDCCRLCHWASNGNPRSSCYLKINYFFLPRALTAGGDRRFRDSRVPNSNERLGFSVIMDRLQNCNAIRMSVAMETLSRCCNRYYIKTRTGRHLAAIATANILTRHGNCDGMQYEWDAVTEPVSSK